MSFPNVWMPEQALIHTCTKLVLVRPHTGQQAQAQGVRRDVGTAEQPFVLLLQGLLHDAAMCSHACIAMCRFVGCVRTNSRDHAYRHMRACVLACVRLCVRSCICVRARARFFHIFTARMKHINACSEACRSCTYMLYAHVYFKRRNTVYGGVYDFHLGMCMDSVDKRLPCALACIRACVQKCVPTYVQTCVPTCVQTCA